VSKNFFAGVFLLALLQFSLSFAANAQVSCTAPFIWYFPDPIPAGATCTGPGQGPYSMFCVGPTGNCPGAPVSVCPTCNLGAATAGNPINLATGNTYIQQKDVTIPGLNGGLALTRTWSSTWPSNQTAYQVGLFGSNWRSSYEEGVYLSGNFMEYVRGDGEIWFFTGSGASWTLSSPAKVTATLSQSGGVWTLAFMTGEQRTFSVTSGSLTSIIDHNGNATTLTYDGSNRLTTIADPAARHLTFNYPNGSSRLVSSVTSDVGLTVTYAYDSSNRLHIVTEQDGSTLTFQLRTLTFIQ
jgi:YD repeat-containing protein